ncbi:MAG: hypothetical protein ACNA8W_23160, partial [Bradymonadaceae bacterium]
LQGRVNISTAIYDQGQPREWFLTSGVHARIGELLGVTVEFVRWQIREATPLDRVEVILHGYF